MYAVAQDRFRQLNLRELSQLRRDVGAQEVCSRIRRGGPRHRVGPSSLRSGTYERSLNQATNSRMDFQEHIELAPCTTLELGGEARYLARCRSDDDICHALRWARDRDLPVHVLGGGSNTVFADAGYCGLVLKIESVGVSFHEDGGDTIVTGAAGEDWDGFVRQCIDRDLSGIECLSGIPGLVGATPMQNVGAYGQEVAESVVGVRAIERETFSPRQFSGEDCRFRYRDSRFKSEDRDQFVITEVVYRLTRNQRPVIRYSQLAQALVDSQVDLEVLNPGRETSVAVREEVIALRRRKSMVLDKRDVNSRSAGSFFQNPVLDAEQIDVVRAAVRDRGGDAQDMPLYAAAGCWKIAAAWLVEQAGFVRGERRAGVGISEHHALALVNYDGSSEELLALAAEIRDRVRSCFGVELEQEPVNVSADG
ncbi:MAG: UDP-N-acetylmuramate dehydrogenase [Candidatus Latescibacterota bacterium]|nr:UDP-N-acetylmuramate dehydrogenase [Candidatus Latescibacterota bacterium]